MINDIHIQFFQGRNKIAVSAQKDVFSIWNGKTGTVAVWRDGVHTEQDGLD